MKRLIVGISGASGVIYGIRLLEVLKAMGGVETHLVMSKYARLNIEIETTYKPQEVEALADVVHSYSNQAAAISSGSFKTDGMVIKLPADRVTGLIDSGVGSPVAPAGRTFKEWIEIASTEDWSVYLDEALEFAGT